MLPQNVSTVQCNKALNMTVFIIINITVRRPWGHSGISEQVIRPIGAVTQEWGSEGWAKEIEK